MKRKSTGPQLQQNCGPLPRTEESTLRLTYLSGQTESQTSYASPIGLKHLMWRFYTAHRILRQYTANSKGLSSRQILLIWLKESGDIGKLFSDEELLDMLQVKTDKQAHQRHLFLINQTLKC